MQDEIFKHRALEILYTDGKRKGQQKEGNTPSRFPLCMKGQSNNKPCMKK